MSVDIDYPGPAAHPHSEMFLGRKAEILIKLGAADEKRSVQAPAFESGRTAGPWSFGFSGAKAVDDDDVGRLSRLAESAWRNKPHEAFCSGHAHVCEENRTIEPVHRHETARTCRMVDEHACALLLVHSCTSAGISEPL